MQTNSFWCFLYPFVIWKLCAFQISFVRALHGGSSLDRPTWLLPDCATCQPSRSPSLWPSRLVTSSLSRYPCLRDLKLFGLASWMLRVLPTLLMPSIFIKMLQHDSSLWVYEVSSSAFCVNLPKSCRKLWSAKSSSRRSKLHSASCLPLRERMKTKVSARVSMPFSFRALG